MSILVTDSIIHLPQSLQWLPIVSNSVQAFKACFSVAEFFCLQPYLPKFSWFPLNWTPRCHHGGGVQLHIFTS